MVVRKSSTNLRCGHQERQENSTHDDIRLCRDLAKIDSTRLVLPQIPAIQIHHKHQIIDDRVRNGGLDAGNHRVLLFSCCVLLPWPAILLDHADELDVAGHDCWHSRDETGAEKEVAEAGHVEEG